jgi:hypothetical protein
MIDLVNMEQFGGVRIRSTLILFSHIYLGRPSGLLPLRFPTKTLHNTALLYLQHDSKDVTLNCGLGRAL